MVYFFFIILVVSAFFFLVTPLIKGESLQDESHDSLNDPDLENLKDHLEATKLSLRDLDLENKIGKIDKGDFEILKAELLTEWSEVEEKLKSKSEKK